MFSKISELFLNIPNRILFLLVFIFITVLAILFYKQTNVFSYILFILLIPSVLLVTMTIGPLMLLVDSEWHYEIIFVCSLVITMLVLYFFGMRLDRRENKGSEVISSQDNDVNI